MAGKAQPIRWTLEKAAIEFGTDRKTLTKKLRAQEAAPAEDGRYSTQQICVALFDDVEAERIRLLQEQSRRLKLANDKKSGEQVDADTVFRNYEGVFIALRQTILASHLSDAEKAECLSNLRHDLLDAKAIE